MRAGNVKLSVLPGTLAICRLEPSAPLPHWALASGEGFFSVTRTRHELSLVCAEALVPEGVKAERNWRAFEVEGPLNFALTGVLASLCAPLAAAKISVFALSTYDTDYLLVRETSLETAQENLRRAGFLLP